MANRMNTPIEGIGTYHLILDNGYHLDLLQTLYVPSVSRNVISISKLDEFGFNVKFGHGCFSLFNNNNNSVIGSGILIDGLYRLKLDDNFAESLLITYSNIGIKRSRLNEDSTFCGISVRVTYPKKD